MEDQHRVMEMNMQRLQIMVGYCKKKRRLRGLYSGLLWSAARKTCGNCSNCLTEYQTINITKEAQMILSCVIRIRNKLGYNVGAALVLRTLRGQQGSEDSGTGLGQASYFWPYERDAEVGSASIYGCFGARGLFIYRVKIQNPSDYRKIKARNPVPQHQPFSIAVKRDGAPQKEKGKSEPPREASALFEGLRALRKEIADAEGIAAYMVFSDATLRDMVEKKPTDEQALLEVSGVGEYKLRKYGKVFLEKIAQFQ